MKNMAPRRRSKLVISSQIYQILNLPEELRRKLRLELRDKVMVALKVDKETNTGLITDIKQKN